MRLKIVILLVTLLLGMFQAWIGRNSMNPDGIAYLDIGEAYFRGDWENAINSIWSPFYPWILALGLLIFKPSPNNEFGIVHLMNFVIYFFAVLSFHFFLSEVMRWQKTKNKTNSFLIFPEWVWIILGYSIFLWASLKFVSVIRESPDLTAIIFFLLSGAFALRIRRGENSFLNFVVLGIVLGFGFLTRTPMFMIAFVFLATAFFSVKNKSQAIARTALALLMFLCISGPFIYALSKSKGYFTIGDSGKLNYAIKVNRVRSYAHWQGGPGEGTPKHPTRKIFDSPPIYEFGSSIAGTYPPWYDPGYWYDGVAVHFNLRQQLNRLLISGRMFLDTLFTTEDDFPTYSLFGASAFTIAFLILLLMSQRVQFFWKDLAEEYVLLLPALFGMFLYAMVLLQPRYVGGYFILFWLALFSSIKLQDTPQNKKLVEVVCSVVAIVMIVGLSTTIVLNTYNSFRAQDRFIHGDVANGLKKMGIPSGTKVANIGYSFEAYWARLARLKIVSEITQVDAEQFWLAKPELKREIYNKFAETGAAFILTSNPPAYASLDGWTEIEDTEHYIYSLKR